MDGDRPVTSDDEMLLGVEQGERWLSRVCHDPPAPKTEELKQRIRLALNERSRLRTARLYRWVGGVGAAAAAAVLFAVVGPFGLDLEPLVDSSRAEAFEQYRDDPITESLAVLAEDVSEFELALGDGPIGDGFDHTFDDLLESIDELISEGPIG